MNLGDAFSLDEKKEAFRRNFHPRRILYLLCGFTKPAPKEKYIAIGCSTPQPRVLVVNSRVSNFVQRRPKLLSAQIQLRAADYDCLDHDSYLDCSKAIDYFTEAIIENQVIRDMARIKICLNPDTVALV